MTITHYGYAIQRSTDGWWWLGGSQWIDDRAFARIFTNLNDAELTFMHEGAPVPMRTWNVVQVAEAAVTDRT